MFSADSESIIDERTMESEGRCGFREQEDLIRLMVLSDVEWVGGLIGIHFQCIESISTMHPSPILSHRLPDNPYDSFVMHLIVIDSWFP